MTEGEQDEGNLILWLAVLVEGGQAVLALFLGWLLDLPVAATLTWTWSAVGAGLLATVPMLMAFFACIRWPVGPLKKIEQFCEEILRPAFARLGLIELAGIAVLAGLGEELLFRGLTQPLCQRWTGDPWLGLALASVIFGLLHCITLTYAILAALLGAFLGWLWLHTGNLLAPMVAHAAYDFVALVVLVRWGNGETPVSPPP